MVDSKIAHTRHACLQKTSVVCPFLVPLCMCMHVRVLHYTATVMPGIAGLMLLCQSRPWLEEETCTDNLKIRIAGKSAPPPVQTAGLIANRMREYGVCSVLVMGAEAVLQAMRALCTTHNFVKSVQAPIWFQPKFITIASATSNRSAIEIIVKQSEQ